MEKLSWYIVWILHHSKFVLIADATICFKMAAAAKRKPESVVPPEKSDFLRITPL